eukprot:3267283-Alexandrium_andersonii.AAC.1
MASIDIPLRHQIVAEVAQAVLNIGDPAVPKAPPAHLRDPPAPAAQAAPQPHLQPAALPADH